MMFADPRGCARHQLERVRPEKGQGNGTADFLSHCEGRWTLHLLPGSGAERRSHHSSIARPSLVLTDVSAAADTACRQLPSGCARLSGLWTQRLFDPGEPERYRKDVPNAEVYVLDAGHFALDTKAEEIATLVREFMKAHK
jgi:hypothetical protein